MVTNSEFSSNLECVHIAKSIKRRNDLKDLRQVEGTNTVMKAWRESCTGKEQYKVNIAEVFKIQHIKIDKLPSTLTNHLTGEIKPSAKTL